MIFKNSLLLFLFIFLCCSCVQQGPSVNEEDDSGFKKAMSLLKIGNDEEALEEFLSVTRRTVHCPKSHLHVGMLFLNLEKRKDPIASIYHFQRFLLLENDTEESKRVKQLIITAEKEIIRNLPGEPFSDQLDSIKLREENTELRRENADLKARLGLPLNESAIPSFNKPPIFNKIDDLPKKKVSQKVEISAKTYEVKKGDSLYGISRKFYGDSSHMDKIFQANRGSLKSKNSLKPGQKLIIPAISQP